MSNPLKTKVFKLEDYNGCVQSLYNDVRDFQINHNVAQIFANDLFEQDDPKIEVVYSTTLSTQPLSKSMKL